MKIASILAVLALTACSTSPPELKYADGSNRIPIKPKRLSPRPGATDHLAAQEKTAAAQSAADEKTATAQTAAPEKVASSQASVATRPETTELKQSSATSVQAPRDVFQVVPLPYASTAKTRHKCSRPNTTPSVLGGETDGTPDNPQFKPAS